MKMHKVVFTAIVGGCASVLHAHNIQAGEPANPSVLNVQRTMKMLEESTAENPVTVRVLFYGQSITAQGWTKILMANLTNRYPTVNFVCENRAIGGYESSLLIRTAESDLYPFYPDILFFHVYGPFDKYEEIVRRVRERTTAEIVLWTSHLKRKENPVEMLRSRDGRSVRILEIAEKYGCLAVDLNRKWSEMMIGYGYTMDDLLVDGIHMKGKGPAWPAYAAFVGGELVRMPGTDGNPKFSGTVTKINLDDSSVKRGKDGAITLSFTGNRVVAVSDGTGSEGATAKLLLDGRPVDSYPEMYANTRPSSLVNWMPMIKLVTRKAGAMPVAEDWTLTYIEGTQPDGRNIHYRLEGSVTGFDGEGWNTKTFVSNSGRVVIEPDDFHVWQYEYAKDKKYYIGKGVDKAKVGDKVEWRTVKMFADPYEASIAGTQTVLVQNCANGSHTLTIIPQGGAIGIGAFIVNAPTRRPAADAPPYSESRPSAGRRYTTGCGEYRKQ